MAINKVVYDGDTLIDLTGDTVTADKLLSGYTAHDAAGTQINGSIQTKTASNMTVSGRTVTAPAGYYSQNASKSIASATQATPSVSIDTDGLITATATQTAGYVSAGTKSATLQLTARGSSDMTASGATVTAPAGYYSQSASKAVATGTAGTPTATKGTVANNKVTITPSVQNTTGYITGGTKTGTAVTVQASELVSGTSNITSNGTFDITNYKSVSVNVSGGSNAIDALIARTISENYVNSTAKTIGHYAFYSCRSLISVSFSICTTLSTSVFACCSALENAVFPKCTVIGSYAFVSCFALASISFPVTYRINPSAFAACSTLSTASFPKLTNISGTSAFFKCFNLVSLYLTNSSVCSLSGSNAFLSTPIGGYSESAGKYGSIYVPASLLASYKAKTNWTYFSSRFVGQ